MKFLTTISILLLFISCNQEKKDLSAQQIIDKAIENAGGEKYENAIITFKFRDAEYSSTRNNGSFEFQRRFKDSIGEVEDVLSNTSFDRFVNGNQLELPDSTSSKYSNSVNSVHYFVQLPYGLNAPAVRKKLIGTSKIKGNEYYKIEVSFAEEGGGDDHDDVYMYWINKKEFTIDYFAYKFYTGKGGIRFREAYNPRIIEGLRFVDYRNYKIEPWENVDLNDLDLLFEKDKMELLSDIKTEDVLVKT